MHRDQAADTTVSSRQSVLRDTGSADSTAASYSSRQAIGRRESLAEGGSSSNTYSASRSSADNGYSSSRYGSAGADTGYSSASRLSRALSSYDTEGRVHLQLKLSVQMTFAIYTFLFWCIVGIYYFRLQSDAHFNMYHELYVKYEQL